MNHQEAKVLLWAYLDGGLEAGQRKKLQGHLAQCPDCFARLDGMLAAERTKACGATLMKPASSSDFAAGVGAYL